MRQIITTPARTTDTFETLIDVILVSSPDRVHGRGVINTPISDHLPVCTSTYPIVNVTVEAPRTSQPSPSIWFCFQLLLGRCKTSTLSTQRCYSPNASFVGPFFSLLALFLVKLSWQALMILIHAQTTLTCVSLLWLRYHYRAQWLASFNVNVQVS